MRPLINEQNCYLYEKFFLRIEEPFRFIFHHISPKKGIKSLRSGSCLPRVTNNNLLVSYPRSGRNFLLFLVEHITQRPSNRFYSFEKIFFSGRSPVFEITHSPYGENEWKKRVLNDEIETLVLLLRDYKECLVRHKGKELVKTEFSVKTFMKKENTSQPPSWYVSNLEAYERFSGKKIIVYYEDLLKNPLDEMEKLIKFLGYESNAIHARIHQIRNDLDTLRQLSVGYYNSHQASRTGGDPSKINFHSSQLPKGVAEEFDDYFAERIPELYKRYLSRYRLTS